MLRAAARGGFRAAASSSSALPAGGFFKPAGSAFFVMFVLDFSICVVYGVVVFGLLRS